jgi:hypothetical protein
MHLQADELAGIYRSPNNAFNRSGINSEVIVNLDAARQFFAPG